MTPYFFLMILIGVSAVSVPHASVAGTSTAGTGSIRGKLLWDDQSPVKVCRVMLVDKITKFKGPDAITGTSRVQKIDISETANRKEISVSEDGLFRFESLQSGTYYVFFKCPGNDQKGWAYQFIQEQGELFMPGYMHEPVAYVLKAHQAIEVDPIVLHRAAILPRKDSEGKSPSQHILARLNKKASFCASVLYEIAENYATDLKRVDNSGVRSAVHSVLSSSKARIISDAKSPFDCYLKIQIEGVPLLKQYARSDRPDSDIKLYSGAKVAIKFAWHGPSMYAAERELENTIDPPASIPLGYNSLPRQSYQAPFAEAVFKAGFERQLERFVDESLKVVR